MRHQFSRERFGSTRSTMVPGLSVVLIVVFTSPVGAAGDADNAHQTMTISGDSVPSDCNAGQGAGAIFLEGDVDGCLTFIRASARCESLNGFERYRGAGTGELVCYLDGVPGEFTTTYVLEASYAEGFCDAVDAGEFPFELQMTGGCDHTVTGTYGAFLGVKGLITFFDVIPDPGESGASNFLYGGYLTVPPAESLMYGTHANRSDGLSLEGSTVSGSIYVWLSPLHPDDVDSIEWVDFLIDGKVRHREWKSPYDMISGGDDAATASWNTREVGNGPATVAAVIGLTDGTTRTVSATLEVNLVGSEQLEVVTAFDAELGELPEGIAIDQSGNIFVSMGAVGGPSGEIRRISPDGTQTTMVELDTAAAGLAVDDQGNVYYAYVTFDETGGVHRLNTDGSTEQLPGTGNILFPNGLGFDDQGNLYVSDSVGGAIWRVPQGGTAELWIQDASLEGCPPPPDSDFPPIGANGVAYRGGNLFVANTDQGLLVRVPIEEGGVAGVPVIVAGNAGCDPTDPLFTMDGIAFDTQGDVYALLVIQNKLVRIDPETGDVTELVSGSGFHNPASLAFGTGEGDRESLFIVNYALLPPVPDPSFGPAVLKLDVGVPGMPLP